MHEPRLLYAYSERFMSPFIISVLRACSPHVLSSTTLCEAAPAWPLLSILTSALHPDLCSPSWPLLSVLNPRLAPRLQEILPPHLQTQQHRQGPHLPGGEKRRLHADGEESDIHMHRDIYLLIACSLRKRTWKVFAAASKSDNHYNVSPF